MSKPMPNIAFAGMSLIFKVRDAIRPPEKVLAEVDISPGDKVLDYGCGPGTFSIAVARMVGDSGKVVALDIHPKAMDSVRKKAAGEGLTNIETVLASNPQGLETSAFDVILLYDIFHDLHDQNGVLQHLRRALKADGILSFSDHHLKEEQILAGVTGSGLFRLSKRGRRTYTFSKIPGAA